MDGRAGDVAHLLNRIVDHAIPCGTGREANRTVPSPLEPTAINSPRIKRPGLIGGHGFAGLNGRVSWLRCSACRTRDAILQSVLRVKTPTSFGGHPQQPFRKELL